MKFEIAPGAFVSGKFKFIHRKPLDLEVCFYCFLLTIFILSIIKEIGIIMVRNYKSKNARKQWSTEDMEKAMEEVRLKHISISRASKTYHVPKETLGQGLKKAPDVPSRSIGKPPVLSIKEETEIAETCYLFAEWGFVLTEIDIINVVAEYLKNSQKKTPSKMVCLGRIGGGYS